MSFNIWYSKFSLTRCWGACRMQKLKNTQTFDRCKGMWESGWVADRCLNIRKWQHFPKSRCFGSLLILSIQTLFNRMSDKMKKICFRSKSFTIGNISPMWVGALLCINNMNILKPDYYIIGKDSKKKNDCSCSSNCRKEVHKIICCHQADRFCTNMGDPSTAKMVFTSLI